MGNKILVVDDDPNICELVSIALSTKGYSVNIARTGLEGITGVAAVLPDLILLDMTLPDMEGIDVAKKIKDMDSCKNVPIIMMSGRGLSRSDVDPSLFAGILNKPFSLTDLVKEAEKYISDHQ
jgi:two-component system, OmpR family, response regulator